MKIDNETKVQNEELNKTKPYQARTGQSSPRGIPPFIGEFSTDREDHLAVNRCSVKGQLEFKAILFIPER